jgi:hypothetical protein
MRKSVFIFSCCFEIQITSLGFLINTKSGLIYFGGFPRHCRRRHKIQHHSSQDNNPVGNIFGYGIQAVQFCLQLAKVFMLSWMALDLFVAHPRRPESLKLPPDYKPANAFVHSSYPIFIASSYIVVDDLCVYLFSSSDEIHHTIFDSELVTRK